MTSLVTGATGFIGRHLAVRLANDGQPLRALCRDDAKRRHYLDRGEEAVIGDVCDPDVVREAVAGVEVVYHCAAAHSTSPPTEIRRTNLQSVRLLLDAVDAAGGSARVILMSSLNVLGNGSYAAATEDTPRRHTGELHVDLKSAAEELAAQRVAQGLDVLVLRPGLVYGPGDPHMPKMAKAIQRGKFVFIGRKDNIVPMIHVSDMVAAMLLAAKAPPTAGRVFNMTDGSDTTIGQLVELLARVLDCPVPTRVLPAIVPRLAVSVCGLLGRDGPVSRSALRFLGSSRQVDISRARRELGFDPQITIQRGIEELQDWLRESVSAEMAA